jgi:hypothetical protein
MGLLLLEPILGLLLLLLEPILGCYSLIVHGAATAA